MRPETIVAEVVVAPARWAEIEIEVEARARGVALGSLCCLIRSRRRGPG